MFCSRAKIRTSLNRVKVCCPTARRLWNNYSKYFVPSHGFEPRLIDSESMGLPLADHGIITTYPVLAFDEKSSSFSVSSQNTCHKVLLYLVDKDILGKYHLLETYCMYYTSCMPRGTRTPTLLFRTELLVHRAVSMYLS